MRSLTEPMARLDEARLVIGVGPGFVAGRDVHVVIESNRGPRLGEPITSGAAEAYTGVPGDVLGLREERLLRAPRAGRLTRVRELGDFVEAGEVVATVEGEPVVARIAGMVRGLKLDGVPVGARHKVGDVDPRRDRALLAKMTDKARAVSLGAVRAALTSGVLSAPPPAPEAPRATPCI
jgi:xanthine dehydrogenase accessory factor